MVAFALAERRQTDGPHGKTQVEVAELFNVDRSTISRLVSERRVLERKA